MKKKIVATVLVSLMLLQFLPLNYLVKFEINHEIPKTSDNPFIPPDDKEVDYSTAPLVHFSIKYKVDLKEVRLNIYVKNNLLSPITLFNLWIQVNKSDVAESIILSTTSIVESLDKLSLSTFDTHKSNDLYGNGSMIFHIKLFEGKVISVNEEYNIRLRWYDPDEILAQYDPNLIYNSRSDDIQVFFQHSTRAEETQPIPIIERVYRQKESLDYEGYMEYILTFRVINLMESSLDNFNFKYVKIKDFIFEQFLVFNIITPFLSEAEIEDIDLNNEATTDKIEYGLSFGESVALEPDEWLKIRIKWLGDRKKSSIQEDFIIWDYGETDNFNKGLPYYLIGLPFYPLQTPAEPIVKLDYDNDGLRNYLEIAHGLDPLVENTWISWTSLRGDYSLNAQAARNLEITAEVVVTIPVSFSGKKLTLKLLSLGLDDTINDLHVNDEILFSTISSAGDYIISEDIGIGFYSIRFVLKHGTLNEDSVYEIKFFLDETEIPDMSSFLQPDSDGDGVFDKFEEIGSVFIPDTDLDGSFDGIDLMPDNYFSYSSNAVFSLNFPIKDMDSNSDIVVNLQIKPTLNDFTDTIPYAGNELMIVPGIKIYGITSSIGGDYLPDNTFTLDDGKTGIMHLIPLKHGEDGNDYSWGGNINYKYNNLAKQDHQILLKFTLVWLIFEHDAITGESNLYHVYKNTDPYIIQGISIMETEPTTVVVGVVGNGRNVRRAASYAEFLAHLYTSQISFSPDVVSDLVYTSATVFDIENLNDTRDNLRHQLADVYQFNYNPTYFIYNTFGYSLSYNLDRLFEAFPGGGFEKVYSLQEINDFYMLPENTFIGMAVTQYIKKVYLEYLDQFVYGLKTDIETKTYNLQAFLYSYVGFSSDIILHLVGTEETDEIEIWFYDMDSKSNDIIMSDTGGYFGYIEDLKVFRFQISIPEYTPPGSIWGDFILWSIYINFFKPFGRTLIRGGAWVMLRAIGLYIGGLNGKVVRILIKYTYVTKITGALDVIFGTIRLIHGIGAYFQGAFNTGLKEGIRGGIMILTGILWIAAEPTGITKIVAIVLTVFQIIDSILLFFGIDIWGWWISTFFGIEDANPDYEITGNSISYYTEKIQSQGGFEVGDSIGVNIGLRNIGNTRLTFGLKVKAGIGVYGTRQTITLYPSNTGTLSAYDTFSYASPTMTITSQVDMSYYYNPPGRWGPVPWPPFIWYIDPPAVSGGPEYGAPNVGTFDIPIFPSNLADFVYLLKTGKWFPTDLPEAEVEVIENEITPGLSEELYYGLSIYGASQDHTYIIEAPEDDLWNYRFTYGGKNYWDRLVIAIPARATRQLIITITPTENNVLYPTDDSIMIRITQEDLILARINPLLNYKILEVIDFDVAFDPERPDNQELIYETALPYFINVTNLGNTLDSYDIVVNGLEDSLYTLFVPQYEGSSSKFYVRPKKIYSALIVFQIPYFEIILPGLREFEIIVSSSTDPTVLKTFDCSIEITQYHRIYFIVEEADLEMTDSDIDSCIYNLDLVNLGNIDETVEISYTDVDIALEYLENDIFYLTPGQVEYFDLILYPLDIGKREFSITASSPFVSETVDASINIIDDDTLEPWFENILIDDNHLWLNISFDGLDIQQGDDSGLSRINIYVNNTLVHSEFPNPSDTHFNFGLPNEWIWDMTDEYYTTGIITPDIHVVIFDADHDQGRDADLLSAEFYDLISFAISLDEMYDYVIWLLGEVNRYIYNNNLVALYGTVTQKLVRVQGLLAEAYQLIEAGELHTGLVRNKIAEAKLGIAEAKAELKNLKGQVGEPYTSEILSMMHNIRNKIVELMGRSIGTEFSHKTSLTEVNIYRLRDLIEENIGETDRESLFNIITLAADKLENVIFDISLGKDTEDSMIQALHALDHARTEIISLYRKGKITVALKMILLEELVKVQMKIFELLAYI